MQKYKQKYIYFQSYKNYRITFDEKFVYINYSDGFKVEGLRKDGKTTLLFQIKTTSLFRKDLVNNDINISDKSFEGTNIDEHRIKENNYMLVIPKSNLSEFSSNFPVKKFFESANKDIEKVLSMISVCYYPYIQ